VSDGKLGVEGFSVCWCVESPARCSTSTTSSAAGRPGLLRHARNHAVEAIGPEGFTTELSLASPEWQAVLEDADGLFDLAPMWDGGYAGVVDHLWINQR
jgi:hypothetical protein